MVTISVDTTTTVDMEQARAILDFLLGDDQGRDDSAGVAKTPLPGGGTHGGALEPPGQGVTPAEYARALVSVWPQLGPSGQRLLRVAAEFAPDDTFTFERLAERLNMPAKSVKAVHRNLSRGLGARDIPVSKVMPATWDGRQNYSLPREIRDAILGL